MLRNTLESRLEAAFVDFAIKGGSVVTMGSKGTIRNGMVVVEDDSIVDVHKVLETTDKTKENLLSRLAQEKT